jgi:endonuclease/exonuclease/phosphatase (EEP) superfamily protein YafD
VLTLQSNSSVRLVISTVFCVFTTIALAICVACQLVEVWILSFFYSFQIHIGILTALGAIAAIVALPRNYYAWLLLLGAIGTTGFAVRTLHLDDPVLLAEEQEAEPDFRVVSFNVLGRNNRGGARIAGIIKDLDPDVVFLMEAGPMRPYLADLQKTFPYMVDCTETEDFYCETIMLSKHPILSGDIRDLSGLSRMRMISAKMMIDGRRVRFIQAHLTKPYFDDRHCEELSNIIVLLRNYNGRLVVGGDFNSSILAPCMQRFMRRLKLKTGPSEPATWPVQLGRFGIPIDHLFAAPPIYIQSTRRIEESAGSNHYGIYSDFVFRE